MSAFVVFQAVVITALVLWSIWRVLRKFAPRLTNGWLASASITLGRRFDSRFAAALSRRLQPKQATGNCADGCATCGACDLSKPAVRDDPSPSAPSGNTIPIRVRPRPR